MPILRVGKPCDLPCVTWLFKVDFGLELRSDAKVSSSTDADTFLICPLIAIYFLNLAHEEARTQSGE